MLLLRKVDWLVVVLGVQGAGSRVLRGLHADIYIAGHALLAARTAQHLQLSAYLLACSWRAESLLNLLLCEVIYWYEQSELFEFIATSGHPKSRILEINKL